MVVWATVPSRMFVHKGIPQHSPSILGTHIRHISPFPLFLILHFMTINPGGYSATTTTTCLSTTTTTTCTDHLQVIPGLPCRCNDFYSDL